jgi:hypothetical protein
MRAGEGSQPVRRELMDPGAILMVLEFPPAIGAKITAKQFEERTAAYWKASRKPGPR